MRSSEDKVKVLIVDDSAFYRQSILKLLEKIPNIEVIGIAGDGLEAMRFLSSNRPDLITLDLEMPKLDGFTFFRWLMKNNPIPSIIISSIAGGKDTLKALDMGAVDFIAKPTKLASMEFMSIEKELVEKISEIAKISSEKLVKRRGISDNTDDDQTVSFSRTGKGNNCCRAVLIGSSTGGPTAVQKVLEKFPWDFPCPILITQHMPKGFTRTFAQRLDKLLQISVKEADAGESVSAGVVYICPGSHHMQLFQKTAGEVTINLVETVESDPYTPSVDVMMSSAAGIYKNECVGVILTGMGHDGFKGMQSIKKAGGYTIAEAEETALIYGMPKVVIDHGFADNILPLQLIGKQLVFFVNDSRVC